jgi:hypothetical protein
VESRKAFSARRLDFVSAAEADFSASAVVEVVVVRGATLPPNSEYAFQLGGPWRKLI